MDTDFPCGWWWWIRYGFSARELAAVRCGAVQRVGGVEFLVARVSLTRERMVLLCQGESDYYVADGREWKTFSRRDTGVANKCALLVAAGNAR